MAASVRRRFPKVHVITGDPTMPDPTKHGGQYAAVDMRLNDTMRAALESLEGFEFEFLNRHATLIARLVDDPPQFVLNFCDTGYKNVPTKELHIPALLELLDIPYSGAPPAAMVIAYDKAIVRMLAQSAGLAVPHELVIRPDESFADLDLRYPALIKPNRGDGSVGITKDAVVHDDDQARAYLAMLRELLPGGVVLAQEYLPGPEYGFALIGNPGTGFTAFPPLEVDFGALPSGLAPILSFESKTDPDSPYWTDIKFKRAPLAEDTITTLRAGAERLFARLQLRDYGRFDFRTGADGVIKLMEVNPNPAWDPEAKLAIMAGFAGVPYPRMLEMLLETAQARV